MPGQKLKKLRDRARAAYNPAIRKNQMKALRQLFGGKLGSHLTDPRIRKWNGHKEVPPVPLLHPLFEGLAQGTGIVVKKAVDFSRAAVIPFPGLGGHPPT